MFLPRRQMLALVAVLAVTAAGGGVLIWRQAARGSVEVYETASVAAAPQPAGPVIVHVCGAVKNPGVYTLPAGARVFEAVAKAGGALPGAEQEAVNLAAPLSDGQQVYLPGRGEAAPPAAASTATSSAARNETAAAPRFPLNLNQVNAADLENIPGIGPALAGRIIAYRQANGPFTQVDDLLNVSGIGEKTLARLRPYLKIS